MTFRPQSEAFIRRSWYSVLPVLDTTERCLIQSCQEPCLMNYCSGYAQHLTEQWIVMCCSCMKTCLKFRSSSLPTSSTNTRLSDSEKEATAVRSCGGSVRFVFSFSLFNQSVSHSRCRAVKPCSDWQVSVASFLRQKTCRVNGDFKAKMHQIRFRLGLRPRPRCISSPRPPSWI